MPPGDELTPAQAGVIPGARHLTWLAVAVPPLRKDAFMDRRIRRVLLGLAVLVVVAVAFSDMMGGRMGSGFERQGPSGQGMMQGHWWTWGLEAFIVLGVVLLGAALVARALGLGRRRRSDRSAR
jgi:protein-S-isoprenylcysteine O-methyltransferase Ste14